MRPDELEFPGGILNRGGEAVVLRWSKGRVQRLGAAFLRSRCECAQCRNLAFPLEPSMFPGLKVEDTDLVGSYALQFRFSDRHDTGAYPFDLIESMPDEA